MLIFTVWPRNLVFVKRSRVLDVFYAESDGFNFVFVKSVHTFEDMRNFNNQSNFFLQIFKTLHDAFLKNVALLNYTWY